MKNRSYQKAAQVFHKICDRLHNLRFSSPSARNRKARAQNRFRFELLEDRRLLATFAESSGILQIDLATGETLAVSSAGASYNLALTGGTFSGTDSANATGNATASLSVLASAFTEVKIDDSGTGVSMNFGNSGSNTYTSSFSIVLDDATAGAITFNGNTAFTGSAALSASTSRNITFNNLATLITVSGDLTLLANQQAVPTDFADNGISVGPDVRLATTSGNITLKGRGGVVNGYSGVSMASYSGTTVVGGGTFTGNITIVGQGGGQSSNGLYMLRTFIATSGGNIDITGTGGTSTGVSDGIYMDVHSFIKTDGAGNLSVTGVGGTGSSANGIVIRGRTDAISAGTGTITLFGNASNATGTTSTGISFQNTPPFQLPGGVISSGNIFITGIGAPGALGLELNSGCPITTTGGNISLIADSMSIVGTVNAGAGSVNLRNYSRARYIDLGSTTDGAANTLGLSNTELNNITANTLNIGDVGTAVINISTSIALNSVTTLNLIAGIINFNGNTISGATVNQIQGTFPYITVEQTAGTIIADGGTMAFGQVEQGISRDLVFTIKNPGLADLTGLDITIDGTNAAEFSVVVSPTAPVAPGGSTTFTIRHAPVATGTKSAALHIASNVSGAINPYDINLTASSTPDISVEQAGTVIADGGTRSFGGVSVGDTAYLVFTVKNPGTGDLTISDITFDGANASEFSVFAAPTTSVPANGSTTFTVRYAPTTIGSKTAALHIANDVAGAKNPYDINLTASSTPDISVEQLAGTVIVDGGTQGFGGVPVGSTADLVFTVKNLGTSGLTISDITIDGADANEFSVFAAPTTSVPVSGSTTFTVRYSPTTIGNKTAALHIANNVPGAKNPYDINLTASSSPDISVEQAGTIIADGGTQGFGSVSVGNTADLVFTVKNPGTSDLTISDITIDGANANEFSVIAVPTTSVPVSGSTTFTVRYAPLTVGTKTAALHIANNVPGAKNPYNVNLTAIAPWTGPMFGTMSVGPTEFYTSLTQVITDIQRVGLSGAVVIELQPTYVSTVETFPLTFSNLGTTATKTLTVRPQAGATGLSISSADTTAATVDLNGAQFVTFDGRPGGTGTAKELTIQNTNTAGVAVRFINEASNNTLKFVTLRGVNTSATSGTVLFSTTTGTNGNDNNTIDTCDVRDGASTPTNGIYSLGTTTTSAQNNSGNTVSNSNIFNFYSSTTASSGVRLDSGNTDWTISGNSFYQTATRAATSSTITPIFIDDVSGSNFTVTGNFIGGDSPGAVVTTQKWTTTGTTAANLFQGIRLNVGTTTASSVQGNTIANMVWTSNSNATALPGVWSGIYVTSGNVNIGTVTGNTIGSGTGTGSISVTTSVSGGTSFGIASSSSGTVVISNNTIGSITTNSTANNVAASLTGISVTAGANTITGNTVGSTTTANSLNAATSSLVLVGQQVTGILSSSSISASITGNTVANLNNNYGSSGSAGQIRGIITSAGVNTITGNTVRNLSTTSRNVNTGMTATTGHSVVGIAAISTTAGQTVSQNTVHSLANTSTSAVNVTGIYYNGVSTGTNLIARNFVHSLAISSTSAGAVMNGMRFATGIFTAQNNMVRVGLKSDGTSTASASTVRGIYDNADTPGRNFYHNSVYVGGTQTSGAANTFAFGNDVGNGIPNPRDYRNNIFVNARSNSGGTGKHYAVNYAGNAFFNPGIANNNIFFVSGTGGVLGLFDGLDRTTLAAWQATRPGRDANSLNADPLFVNPTGTAATLDLHLQSTSPAIGAAVVLASVTNDFDGDSRTLPPTDIGADEFVAANTAPTALVLSPSSVILSENANTSSAIELSTISITDDGVGTNALSLSGTDAVSFEIVADKLRLKAGVTLDFETKSSYTVRVNVDDTTVGGTPDAFADFTLNISDANDAPTALSLSPTSATFAENISTASAIELSTITFTDDALGTNTLSLSGPDAASFEIVAGKLYLKAGAALDYETKTSLIVNVNVDDTAVGASPDASATFTLNLTNITELTGIDVQKGQTQRSFVRNVDILFDNDVGLTDLLSGNRVKLTRMDLNGLNRTAMTLPTNAVSGRQIQLDFGAQGIGGNRNSNVGDGYFEIAIDMDGDGSFESIKHFFRLYGDVTGDGIVDSRDKAKVMALSGTTNVEGDLNGDGVVNLTDTVAVSRAVGRKLKAGLGWDD